MRRIAEISCSVFTYLLFLLIFIDSIHNHLFANEPDFAFKKTYMFKIEENDSSLYDLKSDVQVMYRYLTKRSLKENIFTFYESFEAPVKDVYSYYNGTRLINNVSFESVSSEDIFIENSKQYFVKFFKDLKIDDVIKYDYEEKYRDIAFIPIIQIPNIDSVTNFEINIAHPKDLKVEFDIFFPYRDFKYKISRGDKRTILEFDSLSYIPGVSYMPFHHIAASIMIILKKGDKYINPVQPKEFVNWYYKQFTFKQSFSQKQKTFLDSLFQNVNTTEGKLTAIDDYIKNNVRYIADEHDIHSIIPREPALVLERKYGDCKDRAFLAAAIAKEYGINVYPALLNTEFIPKFNGVHVWSFNHVICQYDDNGKSKFFDPTSKYNEFGSMSEYVQNKQILVLNPANPRVEVFSSENSEPLIEIEIKSHIDSLANCNAKITLKKEYGGYAKHAILELTDLQIENFISNLITSNLRNISVDYFKFSEFNPGSLHLKNNAVSFNAKADLSKFVITTSLNRYITKIPFTFMDNEIFEREKDSLPIYITKKMIPNLKLKISLEVPGYSFSSDSLGIHDNETKTLFFARSTSSSKDIINFEYNLNSPQLYIDKTQKNGFISFCRDFLKNKNQMFQLSRKKL